jgi:predicted ATPase/DNA-binding SARP family transcriptional activator
MRFGILGETRAWRADGTELPLGGPARRALLALLLIRPGAVVSADRLADEIEPGGAVSAHAVQSQVSRLRSSLGVSIEWTGAGYRIAASCDDVDACRFEQLAGEGRAALRGGEPERARTLLRAALELWRGPALPELPDSETARIAAARLADLRLGAIEDRIEAGLRLGDHHPAVSELRELIGRHPLRERLVGLLMRALVAEGGQAAALVVFDEARRRLADELGCDPSPELAALHRDLLRAGAGPRPAAPPAQLTSFVGRTGEVSEVAGLLRVARLVTLTGPGGVGKTRLAVEVAGSVADDVCFVELAAQRTGAGLPQALLAALGLRENGLHLGVDHRGPVDRLIEALADRLLVLVLDNCEHVVDEVAALAARLLSTGPRLRILATSREPLGIMGENLHRVRPLDGTAALRLFADRARAVRRDFVADLGSVGRICAALDGLPLAIELAAARLRTLDLDEVAARLDDRLTLAARGVRTADERHRTLRKVIAWSWDLLAEPEQRAARWFTVFAGTATAEAARRVCGMDEETLESLVDRSLLEPAGGGRYRMLETIRAYGAERLAEAGESEAAGRGHARYFVDLARTADPYLRRAEQLRWLPVLAAEHDNLLAALRWAVETREVDTAFELIGAASAYLWIRGVATSAAPVALALLDAVGSAPPAGLGEEYAACVLLAAAGADGRPAWLRHRAAAQEALDGAWPGDQPGRYPLLLPAWMLRNVGESGLHRAYTLVCAQSACPEPWVRATATYVAGFGSLGAGDAAAAERALDAAADEFGALGDRWGTALVLDALAGLAAGRGDHDRAVALTDRAIALTEELGALEDAADLLTNRGDYLVTTDIQAAHADYARAHDVARRSGSAPGLAGALRGLGDMALLAGDRTGAEQRYREALERADPHWVKNTGNRVRALAGLGRIAEAGGDRSTARSRYAEAAAAAAVMGAAARDLLHLLGVPDPPPSR